MKIKITEAGWGSYSDLLAGVPFDNGVSARDVTAREAEMLGAILRVETLEGDQVGAGPALLASQSVSADTVHVSTTVSGAQDPAAVADPAPAPAAEPLVSVPPAAAQEVKVYTEAELIIIADREGVAGLRLVGDQIGVRSNSIRGLIGAILDAQNGQAAVSTKAAE